MPNQGKILDYDTARKELSVRHARTIADSWAQREKPGDSHRSSNINHTNADGRAHKQSARNHNVDNKTYSRRAQNHSADSKQRTKKQSKDNHGLLAAFKALRRKQKKHTADRKFDRTYDDSADRAAAAQPAGPRAALYEGKMGTSHKRSSRMQENAATQRVAADVSKKARKNARGKGKRFAIASVAVVATISICVVTLYAPAQRYYKSIRENARLQAEYAAVIERNETLQASINSLSTDEGVKEYAHDKLGMVDPGEVAVTVSGTDVPNDSLNDIDASVVSSNIKAPETWYSPLLDKVFGVE